MIPIWEQTDFISPVLVDSCQRGVNDDEFYIPIERRDLINLRLDIPYPLITSNSGSLPIGSNVNLSIVDLTGTTTLCNYGSPINPAVGNYRFAYLNDGTRKIAQYSFLLGLGLDNSAGKTFYALNVVYGDTVVINFAGVGYYWIHGVDQTPLPFIEHAAGRICFCATASEIAASLFIINLTIQTPIAIFGTPLCASENRACFRFKVTVNLSIFGLTLTFFSKPFRVVDCDLPTTFIQGYYPPSNSDCLGQVHNFSGNVFDHGKLYMRIYSDLLEIPSTIEKVANQRSVVYRSSVIKNFQFRSLPIPQFYADMFECIALSKEMKIDGKPYQITAQSLFENNTENIGEVYQNINVNLQLSKCETVFVCN